MRDTGMDRTWSAIVVIICGVLLLGIVLAAIVHGEIPGETVNGTAIFRDDAGVAAVPDSARLFVYRDGTLIRSSDTLAGGRITTSGSVLIWKYLLPSTSPDSARFTFIMRASKASASISNDYFPCSPASFEPSPDVANGTIASMQSGTATSLFSWVSESTYINGISGTAIGQILRGGSPVTGAFVFATSNANGTGVIGYALSSLGDFDLVVPHVSGVSQTIYISAWYQNAWLMTPTAVTLL